MMPLFEVGCEAVPSLKVMAAREVWNKLLDKADQHFKDWYDWGKAQYVAVGNAEWKSLPPTVPLTEVNAKFLKYKPKLNSLYSLLSIL
jgi:hypothetical protein